MRRGKQGPLPEPSQAHALVRGDAGPPPRTQVAVSGCSPPSVCCASFSLFYIVEGIHENLAGGVGIAKDDFCGLVGFFAFME